MSNLISTENRIKIMNENSCSKEQIFHFINDYEFALININKSNLSNDIDY